ncbi:hypothetical protein GCM10009557_45010 [Virgisporangium ochraceum]
MPYLVVAVVLTTALGLLNLLLTFAVLRRLREAAARERDAASGVIGIGRTPADFAATDTDGRAVGRDDLTGRTLVGFFSTTCSACVEELPRFEARAGDLAGGRERVLAVVHGDPPAAEEMARRLAGVARVVVDDPHGPVGRAFEVRAYPAWCLLDDGVVDRTDLGADPVPAAAAA